MSGSTHRRDRDVALSETSSKLPGMLQISFDGPGTVASLRGDAMSIDTWQAGEAGPALSATMAIRCRGMALHFEFDALALRAHAAACLRAADKLDDGRGKQ